MKSSKEGSNNNYYENNGSNFRLDKSIKPVTKTESDALTDKEKTSTDEDFIPFKKPPKRRRKPTRPRIDGKFKEEIKRVYNYTYWIAYDRRIKGKELPKGERSIERQRSFFEYAEKAKKTNKKNTPHLLKSIGVLKKKATKKLLEDGDYRKLELLIMVLEERMQGENMPRLEEAWQKHSEGNENILLQNVAPITENPSVHTEPPPVVIVENPADNVPSKYAGIDQNPIFNINEETILWHVDNTPYKQEGNDSPPISLIPEDNDLSDREC